MKKIFAAIFFTAIPGPLLAATPPNVLMIAVDDMLLDIYPTLVELCGLKPDAGFDGQSLAAALKNPAAAKDRYAFTIAAPNEYSVVNTQWRYIHYADGAEEFYNEKGDAPEWTNLAAKPEYRSLMDEMKAAAPATFAAPGKKRGEMKLVTEGESFHWDDKPANNPGIDVPKKKSKK